MKDQDTSNCAAPKPIDILWAAVNSYAVAIGGDPSSTDNKLERSRASTDVEDAAFAMGGDEPVLTSLLDMVDALPGNAGLKPVLRRMVETLGDHHERLSTFEEHHADPDDTAPDRAQLLETLYELLFAWSQNDEPTFMCDSGNAVLEALWACAPAPKPGEARRHETMPSKVSPWCCMDRGCNNRDVPESGTAGEIWARYGTGPVPDEPAPSSKSGQPTDAAEEIARLTDECKRGDETMTKLVRLNRQLTQAGHITPRPGGPHEVLLRMPRKVHDELCELLTRIPV